jgi:hypothetical protein
VPRFGPSPRGEGYGGPSLLGGLCGAVRPLLDAMHTFPTVDLWFSGDTPHPEVGQPTKTLERAADTRACSAIVEAAGPPPGSV